MNDRTPETSPISSSSKPEAAAPAAVKRGDKRSRLARGTEQEFPSTDMGDGAPGDNALDDALRRGIALLCAEQLEHSFFTVE